MVALTGIHENVMLSNLSSIGTKGAIESVRIHSLSVFWEGWIIRKSLKAFFPQGQSKLSVIISFPTKQATVN